MPQERENGTTVDQNVKKKVIMDEAIPKNLQWLEHCIVGKVDSYVTVEEVRELLEEVAVYKIVVKRISGSYFWVYFGHEE